MCLLKRYSKQHSPLRLVAPLSLLLLLLAARPHPGCATAPQQDGTTETFPVKRLVNDIREAGLQTVGRDGPRYPDDGFLSVVRKYTAAYSPFPAAAEAAPSDGSAADKPLQEQCGGGFAILTMGNDLVMENLMPLLLESLRRIELPAADDEKGGTAARSNLARHTLVVGVNTEALQACIRLRRRYKNGCLSDGLSGLHEGDLVYPSFQFLSYGMAKLKYIVNALSTGAAILWLDADVVLLRNPFPDLMASDADVAVATAPAPCGSQPSKPDWAFIDGEGADATGHHHVSTGHHHAEDTAATHGSPAGHVGQHQNPLLRRQRVLLQDAGAAVVGYAPGITFYRSNSGVMRCAYSLLLDMLNVALKDPNATVLEQEHFASFMPACTEALDLQLAELPQQQYLTAACAAGGADAVAAAVAARDGGGGGDVVAVHVSGGVLGRAQRERLPLLHSLMGTSGSDLMETAANYSEMADGKGGGGSESVQA